MRSYFQLPSKMSQKRKQVFSIKSNEDISENFSENDWDDENEASHFSTSGINSTNDEQNESANSASSSSSRKSRKKKKNRGRPENFPNFKANSSKTTEVS